MHSPIIPTSSKKLIIDSGASGHYFPVSHLSLLYDVTQIADPSGVDILLPDGTALSPSHSGFLRSEIPLPKSALHVFVFPELQHALLSIALLCDHDCTALFSKRQVLIQLNGVVIFSGFRCSDHSTDPLRDLWTFALPTAPCLPVASSCPALPIAPALPSATVPPSRLLIT